MSFVLEGLYLGGFEEACDTDGLKSKGVTHILTVESKPLTKQHAADFLTKFVHALDMESEDLLSHLDECTRFIDEARSVGGVLVHCLVGQSRSATVVLAYCMKKMDLTLNDALTILVKNRPEVGPNPGFMEQLRLFEQMGNRVDQDSSDYKMYRLNLLSQQIQKAQAHLSMPHDILRTDPSVDQSRTSQVYYKCGKCRRPLFMAKGRMKHPVSKHQFHGRRHSSHRGADNEEGSDEQADCTMSLFIEPVQWMAQDILQVSGKLNCPKCRSKLGSFTWIGEQCPCGRWVTPAFHIQPSKVDFVQPHTAPVAARVAGHSTTRTSSSLPVITSSIQQTSYSMTEGNMATLLKEDT